MNPSRRELCLLLPALLAAAPGLSAGDQRLGSCAWILKDFPIPSGTANFQPVFAGTTGDGYRVTLCEAVLAPSVEPHPPHRHQYEEVFMIREGTLEFTFPGDGSSRLGSGAVVYVASNMEHGIQNVGQTDARYFVLALGTDRFDFTSNARAGKSARLRP